MELLVNNIHAVRRMIWSCVVALPVILMLTGCATVRMPGPAAVEVTSEARLFFEEFDARVRRSKAHDAATFPVEGYPHLRADRFLVGMKDRLSTEDQWRDWLDRMYALGLRSRRNEMRNLNPDERNAFLSRYGLAGEAEARELLQRHAATLQEEVRALSMNDESLREAVQDPGEYSVLYRVAGLHPLWAVPITIGAKGAYDGFREWFTQPWDSFEVVGNLVRYGHGQETMSAGGVRGLFDLVPRDGFGLPVFTEAQQQKLAETFAPVIVQDVSGDYDRIGEVVWRDGAVSIDTGTPVVYYYFSETLLEDEPVWQINYVHWYTKRSGPVAPWIERGRLDGITTRITLDNNGQPLILDVMNTCGCYHFFTPAQKRLSRIKTISKGTDPLVLGELPEEYPTQALAMRIMTGWHQVLSLFSQEGAAIDERYTLRPYAELESLPTSAGGYSSAFDTKGVMKDSTRYEGFFFFPSGIKKIGYMRQRGNHPTKMVGKQYFTGPQILNKRFEFVP